MRPRRLGIRRSILVLAATSSMAGCVTDSVQTSSNRTVPPEPRTAAPTPEGTAINTLAVLKSQRPIDTNGNGFPNRLDVAVYLFSRPYPAPRHSAGTLRFLYYPMGSVDPVIGASEEPLAEWVFEQEVLPLAAIDDIIGQGYAFALDLSSIGLSSLPVDAADLVVEFAPTGGGDPVRSPSVQRVPFRVQ